MAIDAIDLAIPRGQFRVLPGPNGAGKSTLLRLFATLARPTAGSLRIHGFDPKQADGGALRRRIGLLSHESFLYEHLSGFENLLFYARLYALSDPEGTSRAALSLAGLEARGADRVLTYSRGMQQRLAIARALLHAPDVVLLDEPFTGLDPEAAEGLEARLRALSPSATCLMATHDHGMALSLADRIIVLASGRMVADRPARALDAPSLGALFRSAAAGRWAPRGAAR